MSKNNYLKKLSICLLCAILTLTCMPSMTYASGDEASGAKEVTTTEEAKPAAAKESAPAKEKTEEKAAPEKKSAEEAPEANVSQAPKVPDSESQDTNVAADSDSDEITEEAAAEDASSEQPDEAVSEIVDPEADEDAEDSDEVEYPAQNFSGSAGGVSVSISAPEGALPEGSTVEITSVSAESVIDKAQAVTGDTVSELKAVDISFRDKDGKEIEPKEHVTVTMTASGLDTSNGAKVVHIADDGSAELMASVSGNTASFKSDEFSVYLMSVAAAKEVKPTIHITNILYSARKAEGGHAVAFEDTFTMVKGQSKKASGLISACGGRNHKAGGVGYYYQFLNVFVDATGGVVTADSAAGLKTINKFTVNNDGNFVIYYDDGSKVETNKSEVYVSPVYKATADWYLNYYYVDNVSTGSGSWSNKDGVVSFKHTFSDPSKKTKVAHYQFVKWHNTDPADKKKDYYDGDENVYSGINMKSGETKNVYIYAIWQPSVTINYHVLGKTEKTEERFDKDLKVYDYTPESVPENTSFAGWYDKNGNLISEETIYALPAETGEGNKEDVIQPAVHDVYARFTTTHTAKKVWDDEDNKRGLRKDAVEVKLIANGEETEKTATLSANNDWTYKFENLNAYDSNDKLINYTVVETTDLGDDYDSKVSKAIETGIESIVTNTVVPKITLTAASDSKVYDGKALSNKEVKITDGILFATDRLEAEATGSVTNVADSAKGNNVIEKGKYKIIRTNKDGKETDVTNKYNITLVPGTLEITPAPLTITTPSATKVFDGKALTRTAGKAEGLVEGETATVTGTGSQTAVGSSKNGYRISWDSADESNYTIVKENIGTLTVTPAPAPAGGGGNPGGGNPGGGNPAGVAPAGAAIPDNAVPQAAPETNIPDAATPLAQGAWALVNLIATIVTVIGAIVALFRRKEEEDEEEEEQNAYKAEDEEEEDDNRGKKMLAAKIAGVLAGIAAPIVFFLTEDMSLPMIMVDKWTVLMLVILAVQIVAAICNKKASELDDDEDEEDANGAGAGAAL